ncbi:MAG: response regulator transcription factor [Methylococcales bacterium]|nr:response regulator transcription factor [Methylococcales bacterium]
MKINKQDVTIYVVDDEFPIRDSLGLLIESVGLKVKGYESALAFLESYDPEQPGCLVLDMRMPYMDGLELQEALVKANSELPIIFISGHADIPVSSKAFRAGALDFIEKPFDNKILLERINEAVDSLLVNWSEVQKKRQIITLYEHLTDREKEVLKLIVNNHSTKQAAKKLGISNRTVDVHRAHIMEKMQADSLNTLVILAVTAGIQQ